MINAKCHCSLVWFTVRLSFNVIGAWGMVMGLNAMKKHPIHLGTFVRSIDGEVFDISGCLYESPPHVDFWTCNYVVANPQWGQVTYMLTVPKEIAGSVTLGLALMQGFPLDQVKSYVQQSTNQISKPIGICLGREGWTLQ